MAKEIYASGFWIDQTDKQEVNRHLNYLAEDGRYEQLCHGALSDRSSDINRFKGPVGDDWSRTHMSHDGEFVCAAILYSSDKKRLIKFFKPLEEAKREGGMNGREKGHLMGFEGKLYLDANSGSPDDVTCMVITGKRVMKLF